LDSLFPDVDAVIHAGAIVPGNSYDMEAGQMFDVNVRATLELGRWALGRNLPFLFVSSSSIYADPDRSGIVETDPTTPHGLGGFYGLTKLLAEQILSHLSEEGLRICTFRPSSLYGAGLPSGKTVTKYIATAEAGETIEIRPPVEDRVDMIHASDVAEAALRALECGACGTYNIASEKPASFREIAEACVQVVGRGSVRVVPGPAEPKPRVRFGLDCGKAREAFGFVPKVDLAAGLESMRRERAWAAGESCRSGDARGNK
jgi:UDP-glucose 4-epimerase